MKMDIFVLALLKFKDDSLILSKKELDKLTGFIAETLQLEPERKEDWAKFQLSESPLKPELSPEICATIKSATLGYYHHRVIVNFSLDGVADMHEMRYLRSELLDYADALIERSLLHQGYDELESFYSYPILVVKQPRSLRERIQGLFGSSASKQAKRSKYEELLYSGETTSLSFEIVDPKWWMPIGHTYKVRISIPSTILYTTRDVGKRLLRDIINSVYQYCLYTKKLDDSNSRKAQPNIQLTRRLSEQQLVSLWEHIINNMGGRSTDANMTRISLFNYLIAIGAFVLAIVTLFKS